MEHIETFTADRYFIMTLLKQQEKVLQRVVQVRFMYTFWGKQCVKTISILIYLF